MNAVFLSSLTEGDFNPTFALRESLVEGDFLTGQLTTAADAVRGRWRTAGEPGAYQLYVGQDVEPDPAIDTPITFESLPYSLAIDPGHTYHCLLRYKNQYGLESQNVTLTTLIVDADYSEVLPPPSGPAYTSLTPVVGGAVQVHATYLPAADAYSAGNQWLIYLAEDADPDPELDTPTVVTMSSQSQLRRLKWTSGALTPGAEVRCLVRTRRSGSGGSDSANSDLVTATIPTTPPAAPEPEELL